MSGTSVASRDLGYLRVAAETLQRTGLAIDYDGVSDIVTIEGIRYAGELFRQFGSVMPLNTPLKIIERTDGVLAIAQMEPGDPDWGAA